MIDGVVECMVKRNMTMGAAAGRGGIIAFDLLFVFAMVWVSLLKPELVFMTPLLLIIPILLTFFVFRNTNLEYEYAYFDGELVVDKIMGRKVRKRLATYNINKMEVMAPVGSSHIRNGKGEHPIVDYTAHGDHSDSYSLMVYDKNNSLIELRIDPNDDLIAALSKAGGRKVYIEQDNE